MPSYRCLRALALPIVLAGAHFVIGAFLGNNAGATPARACADATARLENAPSRARPAIPAQLLHALSLAESGRWDAARQASFAWPWTVTANGEGRFFATKDEAIAATKRLRAAGVRNIDVGCMQVNLFYHPRAFASLEDAFDPTQNAAYAARYLTALRSRLHSWTRAVAHYHSADAARGGAYAKRVTAIWHDARRAAFRATRLARIEAYAEAKRRRTGQAPVPAR